jgi:hypothetical protein
MTLQDIEAKVYVNGLEVEKISFAWHRRIDSSTDVDANEEPLWLFKVDLGNSLVDTLALLKSVVFFLPISLIEQSIS